MHDKGLSIHFSCVSISCCLDSSIPGGGGGGGGGEEEMRKNYLVNHMCT